MTEGMGELATRLKAAFRSSARAGIVELSTPAVEMLIDRVLGADDSGIDARTMEEVAALSGAQFEKQTGGKDYPGDLRDGLPLSWYVAHQGERLVLEPVLVREAIDKLRLALSKLVMVGGAMQTLVRAHNSRMISIDQPSHVISSPVSEQHADAMHNARMALDKLDAVDAPPDARPRDPSYARNPVDEPFTGQCIDDPMGELLAITLFKEDRAVRAHVTKRAPISGLGLQAPTWLDCPEDDRQVYRDMARGKRPLP